MPAAIIDAVSDSSDPQGPVPVGRVVAPSAEHATPRAACDAILDAYHALPAPGDAGWITFVANEDDDTSVQYVEGIINLVRRPLDLEALLRRVGADALADDVEPERARGPAADVTLWRVVPCPSDRVAAILDHVFAQGRELGPDYRLQASFESSETKPRGPLGRSITTLSLAGWLLLFLACATIALVAFVIGPWVLDLVGLGRLRKTLPVFLDVLMIPGLLAGIVVYLLGHRLLARACISTQRAPSWREPTV